MAAPTAPDEQTNTYAETRRRKMHENLTNAKIHKLIELFVKAGAIGYFYRYLRSPAYG